jgi:UPF0042 nucleotide-binding protein
MVDVLLVTGLSGAGKSTTLKVLEDYGYFAIDNLPVTFLESLIKLILDTKLSKIALGMDIRSLFDSSMGDLVASINDIKKNDEVNCSVVFLTSTKEKILERFRNTKRSHPLMKQGLGLDECIEEERKIMERIAVIADYVIDTSELTVKTLRSKLKASVIKKKSGIKITITSFGYKYGIPLDADLVFDVRILPNPFYVSELKALTGHDKEIQEYLNRFSLTREIITKYTDLADIIAKSYSEQDRSYLNICVGCTGGHHRSVYIAEKITEFLRQNDYNVKMIDRDIKKEQ